jgi:hypothetical protein
MAEIIESLRTDFSEIVGVYSELIDKRDAVAEKVAGLKERYNDLVKQNAQPMFLFCLESLFFQYKILNLEMENYQKSASLIQNRIYGDYYKLYNMMTIQCKENNIDISNSSTSSETAFPLYKDIDPFFKYRIEDVVAVHDKILEIVGTMDGLSTRKAENIRHHRENVDVGFSLRIFLQTLEYENVLIKGQIRLYVDYIQFYHSSQRTYLEKLVKKIVDFTTELDEFILIPNPMAVLEPTRSNAHRNPATHTGEMYLNNSVYLEFSEDAYQGDEVSGQADGHEEFTSEDSQPDLELKYLYGGDSTAQNGGAVKNLGALLDITVPDESVAPEPEECPPLDDAMLESIAMEEFTNMIVDDSPEPPTDLEPPLDMDGAVAEDVAEDGSVVMEEGNPDNNIDSHDSLPDPDNNEDGSYEEASH